MATIDEQLDATGRARVIVVLKPTKTRKFEGRMKLALAETISLQQEAAKSLEKYFKPFRNSRTATLAHLSQLDGVFARLRVVA